MKGLSALIVSLILLAYTSCKSKNHSTFNTPADIAKNNLDSDFTVVTPPLWTQELYTFPIDFAKQLPYEGYADVRFSPFWGNSKNDEFWAYEIFWWITNKPTINEETLAQTLQDYYTGLARKDRGRPFKPSDAETLAKAKVTKVTTDAADIATYNASAHIFDGNISFAPLDLNFKIHEISCDNGTATVIIIEISPKEYSNEAWQTLDNIKSRFKCNH